LLERFLNDPSDEGGGMSNGDSFIQTIATVRQALATGFRWHRALRHRRRPLFQVHFKRSHHFNDEWLTLNVQIVWAGKEAVA